MNRLYLAIAALVIAPVFAAEPPARAVAPAKVADATVELPQGIVFYRDSGGAGTPVVFLHAASGNSMMWENQIPAFTAAGFRFIAVDYRGIRSGGGNINSVALIHGLMTRLGIEKFHLVGTAAGGGVAFQYAIAYPESVRSVTVANSIGGVQDAEYTELGNRLRPPQFNQLPLDFRELGPSYRAANAEGVKRWLQLSSEGSAAAAAAAPRAANPDAAAAAPAATRGAAPGNAPAVTWENLESLPTPTLLMTGDSDLYTPPSVLRLFAARMKKAEVVIVPESGHSAYWESPETFNGAVLSFVGKH